MIKSCFFLGHRHAPEALYPMLLETVERFITEEGVTEFLVGHYGDFDRMAKRAVMELRERYPFIRLTLLLPFHPSTLDPALLEGFDGSLYPPGMETTPPRAAIPRANRYALRTCGHAIFYSYAPASSSRDLLEYAERRAKKGLLRLVNLADLT